MKIRLYALITAFALTGCSLQTIKQQSADNESPPIYKQGEFNRESMYELLVAELAGQKGQFELAMANYLKQARLTRDPNIAERATRVAQYLRNVEAKFGTSSYYTPQLLYRMSYVVSNIHNI